MEETLKVLTFKTTSVLIKCIAFVRKSLTKYSNKHRIGLLRIENESFAGDAFMRHLIFYH